MLYLDFETKSDVDLPFYGLRRYAEDMSTKVLCMAWAIDDEPIELWWADDPFPQRVIDYINGGGPITTHHADFERPIFEWVLCPDYDFDPPALTQYRCSMVQSLANGFAGGLDAMAVGLGIPYRKNPHGTRLIGAYCAPGHADIFDPQFAADRELMGVYCVSDVEVMRAAVKCLRPLSDHEWREYHITCEINDRGIPIDVPFCEAALGYSTEIAADANREIEILTGGAMTKFSQRKTRDAWVLPKLTLGQLQSLEVYKKGEKKISFDRDHREALQMFDDLDPDVRELMEQIDAAGSSALKKFSVAFTQHVDGRVHNTFLFNGAGRTGRFSGKGIQPHNFRRDVYGANEAEALIHDIMGGYEVTRPANTMARLLRSMITHEDGLYWVDYSSIEGRVAPWLAATDQGEEKLDLFREGRDVYVVTAAFMFSMHEGAVDAAGRQAGKIAELSLQFGGSHDALIGMARNYGVVFEEDDARDIVTRWRAINPWAPTIWDDYGRAISEAVRNPGTDNPVGRVVFHSDGPNFLWCQLPSDRLLSYPKPRFEPYETPWGEERIGVTFQSHFKPAAGEDPIRMHARGALLFQNSVQACAADVLREALVASYDAGLDIILHCHDEIGGIGDPTEGELLNEIMLRQPAWAPGLPIATGGVSTGKRYGK